MSDGIRNKLIKWFYDLPLSRKLLFSYFIVTFVPLLAFGFTFYKSINESESKMVNYSMKQAFSQTMSYMEYKIKYINNIMDVAVSNDLIQEIVKRKQSTYENDVNQMVYDMDRLSKFISNLQFTEGIDKISIYQKDGTVFNGESGNMITKENISDKVWLKELLSNKNNRVWCPSTFFSYESGDSKKISVVKFIKDLNQYDDYIGILRAQLSEKNVTDILSKAKTYSSAHVFIVNSKHTLVSASDEKIKSDKELMKKVEAGMLSDSTQKQTWKDITLNREKTIMVYQNISGTDWTMIEVISKKEILYSSRKMGYTVLLLFMGVLALIYISIYFVSVTNSSRLKKFVHIMKKAEKGDFNVAALPNNKDEIGELGRNFNSMLTKIAILMEEKFMLGQGLKSAELKALQSQINPHFLYNTLDSIYWSSFMGKDEELREVVVALSKFYKLSLSQGRDLISLEDELAHVRYYVEIQNMRFKNGIELVVNVNQELLQYEIIKITLQPIIENSIIHGIMEKTEKKGRIIIDGHLSGDDLIVYVRDDGVGINEEKLEKIKNGLYESKESSYGIRNINERLKMKYGAKYGVYFESELGVGTCVKIVIPAIKINLC